ncbi:HpcH/HpaI aldolase/citrate lyase family protein [Paraburkholderia sp. ZP32-5]|uniref:HpcH/HpaI aldolase/citrate lyase family protein n=1 Tax=Paraburkholderia sp. ZP32-5 TaxID=2883245 RepID=UPI001F16554B|nr:CoA ester lyase [Paraburkholderia sp. ZP32-5]
MKSKLFVPGSRPELFPKALASAADAISFDLEDAVAPDAKPRARGELQTLFASGAPRASGKTIIVRVNAYDTPWFADDLRAIVRTGVDLINLPKPDSAAQVRDVARAIARAEQEHGLTQPIRLLLNIETPKSLRIAHELAAADERVAGLQLGLADLFEPIGIAREDSVFVRHAMFAVRVAAAEAGVFAFDSSFADIADVEGFNAEARFSRDLGYIGKSCIHPSQIALANAVFRPTDEQIAHALKVVEAARDAQQRSVGAYVVDGKMIDPPFVARAEAIVAAARGLGLLPADSSARMGGTTTTNPELTP